MTNNYEITVFTMTHCPACVTLKKWLKKQDITFTEKDIVTNEEHEKEFLKHGLKYTPTTFITANNETHQIVGAAATKKIEKILSSEVISK
ncbi:glutaredoxin domain-containing protein [Priestia sp. TSO9]|uniref:glutaredoxin family protein n=1 Tax=Priestia sp. TSO9 TaxID=2885632 RepID=UPI001E41CBE7|nr:glutaredoxin domain-containing protein [Priestia sp. TSO9]